jgi:hypothetical protein
VYIARGVAGGWARRPGMNENNMVIGRCDGRAKEPRGEEGKVEEEEGESRGGGGRIYFC